ncbi:unnamed protein product, partial [Brachionus calyciflorus]
MLNISTPNLLLINKQNEFVYPDFYFQQNESIQLTWKIYFKCLIDQKFYMNIYEFSKTFNHQEQQKQFDITAKFVNTSLILTRNFIISNYQYTDLNCLNSNKTINNTLECFALLMSQKVMEFKVEHEDCTIQRFNNSVEDLVNGFGTFFQEDTLEVLSSNSSYSHILSSSSEILFNSNLIGFELFTYSSVRVKINLWSSSECKDQSCFSFLTQSLNFSAIRLNSWTFDSLEKGLNRFLLDTYFQVNQNMFFSIESKQQIAMYNTEKYLYPDFIINGTSLYPIEKKKLIFKALVDTRFYMRLIPFKKVNQAGIYQINIGKRKKNFTVSNHKSMEIFCPYIKEYDLECYISIISQTQENQIFVDYGDCSNQIFLSQNKKFVNFFGYEINATKVESIDSITFEKDFLIVNSEFKYDSDLIGFEIFATNSGFVNLQ